MCGINGIVSRNTSTSRSEIGTILQRMNDLIIHRGPDDDGVFLHGDGKLVGMGMRRLSIIDLTTGAQPMYANDEQLVIVFNGEIYNYKTLKKQLQEEGVEFKTTSDTEVILKLYEREGPESFQKLDGMFAFSIYDKTQEKIYIARDFFGEKPLYYYKTGQEFYWASELKSILGVIDHRPKISALGLNLYFRLTYIPAPYTIYEPIHKLEPNHYLCYDIAAHDISIHPLMEANSVQKNTDITFDEAKSEVKRLVRESVISRSVSDVPIGTFLSGGVDSSIVTLCLAQHSSKPINTFSIGFPSKMWDESYKSREVAEQIGSKHHEFILGEDELKKNVHEILINFDEPFADSSSLPSNLISKMTSEHLKVALTGDGGDEVFGGYNKYYIGRMNQNYTRFVPSFLHKIIRPISNTVLRTSRDSRGRRYKLKRLLNSIDYTSQYYWDIISLGFTDNHLSAYLNEPYLVDQPFQHFKDITGIDGPDSLLDFRKIDRHVSLEGDMLVKVDRTSMLNSLECRAPFLNRKIWEFSNSLPDEFLLQGWNKKYILKEAFKDEFSDGFLYKSKSGFGAPAGDLLKTQLRQELESYIDEDRLKAQDIFQIGPTRKLVTEHLDSINDNSFRVWTFYCFQKWYYNIHVR